MAKDEFHKDLEYKFNKEVLKYLAVVGNTLAKISEGETEAGLTLGDITVLDDSGYLFGKFEDPDGMGYHFVPAKGED